MRSLLQRQLDKQILSLRSLLFLERPNSGWLKTIRNALGMTQQQVSQKLGKTKQALDQLEKSEQDFTITLHSLQNAAQALNCRVVYALIPEKPLQDIVEQQIHKKAQSIINAVGHTMQLENQETSDEELVLQLKAMVEDIKRRQNISFIWEEENPL
jgi:predicted DNA-binding mobile mystery protein A